MKFSVDGACTSFRAALAMSRPTDSSRINYLVLLIAFTIECKLDMEQHCDWIVRGTVGLRGKGCTRMRPKLHLPVLGHAL